MICRSLPVPLVLFNIYDSALLYLLHSIQWPCPLFGEIMPGKSSDLLRSVIILFAASFDKYSLIVLSFLQFSLFKQMFKTGEFDIFIIIPIKLACHITKLMLIQPDHGKYSNKNDTVDAVQRT